ncbi:hypothetical protein ACFS07_32595 [Undibacterium arcticum]
MTGNFNIQTGIAGAATVQGISHKHCRIVQRADGYGYVWQTTQFQTKDKGYERFAVGSCPPRPGRGISEHILMNIRFSHRLIASVVALTIGATPVVPVFATTADEVLGLADMTRAATQRIAVQQAVMSLATESSDIDGDGYIEAPVILAGTGPVGGGIIPLSSAAPKDDSYGVKLGYCSWDNGSTNSSVGRITGVVNGYSAPVFAVISAGIDNAFQTSCADIAAGTGAKGDDFLIAYSSTQLQMGTSGTLFFWRSGGRRNRFERFERRESERWSGASHEGNERALSLECRYDHMGVGRLGTAMGSIWRWLCVKQSGRSDGGMP